MVYVASRKAAAMLGLHPQTLRRYAEQGKIPHYRNSAGQRLYDVDAYLRGASWPTVVCYCRVSSAKQRGDLNRQVAQMRELYPDAEIVTDVASGLNWQRKGLLCPASTIFAGWRQSVLPVHLLGLAPLLGSVGPVAGDVKLQDDGVVHDPVNRRGGGHGVGKDALPLREDQV